MDSRSLATTIPSRRPYFIDDEDDLEAGFSGNIHSHPFFNKSNSMMMRRNSMRNLSAGFCCNSPRSARFYQARFDDVVNRQPYFLQACFYCSKSLGENKDIFMYRGDTPFCSEECRKEQIEIDECKEKSWNISSMKALRKKEESKNSSSPNKTSDYNSYRSGTVAAA